jgi:hypothetical protein
LTDAAFGRGSESQVFLDISGWDQHASCTASACPLAGNAGIHGMALHFDGIDDNLTLGNLPELNFTGKVTLE